MTKKQYLGLIILAVAVLSFCFYWFSYRPSTIKKNCYNEAKTKAIEKENRELNKEQDFFSKDSYEFYYKICLQSKGL